MQVSIKNVDIVKIILSLRICFARVVVSKDEIVDENCRTISHATHNKYIGLTCAQLLVTEGLQGLETLASAKRIEIIVRREMALKSDFW